MKKHWSTSDYKKVNQSRSNNRLKRNLKHKEKKRKLGRLNQNKEEQEKVPMVKQKPVAILPVPEKFSFIEHTVELIEYLDSIEKAFSKGKNVFIDFSGVKYITNDAIVLFLSKMWDPRFTKNNEWEGNYPEDPEMKEIFVESGMFKRVNRKHGSAHNNSIITRKYKRAEGHVANELIKRATKTLHNSAGRCPGVYRGLMEIMANTCYHAVPNKTASISWWLTVYHNKSSNTISFAFVDTGVGIFKSEKVRLMERAYRLVAGGANNIDIMKELLGTGRSRTNLPYRGHGLPALFKGLKRNYYNNLKIISNDVHADVEKDSFVKLKRNFSGTFIYWELSKNNSWIDSE